jgi:hypothetical protein
MSDTSRNNEIKKQRDKCRTDSAVLLACRSVMLFGAIYTFYDIQIWMQPVKKLSFNTFDVICRQGCILKINEQDD